MARVKPSSGFVEVYSITSEDAPVQDGVFIERFRAGADDLSVVHQRAVQKYKGVGGAFRIYRFDLSNTTVVES